MRALRFFSIFFIFAVLDSCRLPFEPYTTNLEHLVPLAYGNYWMYNVRQYDEKGMVIDSFYETVSVIDSQKDGGSMGYVVDYGTGHLGLWSEYHGDLYVVNDTNGNALPILRYPMNPGETVPLTKGVIHDLGKFEKNLKYFGENQSVVIPTGSYSCYHYETITMLDTSNRMQLYRTQDSYYAANVGLVEEVDSTVINGVMTRTEVRELTSYRVNDN